MNGMLSGLETDFRDFIRIHLITVVLPKGKEKDNLKATSIKKLKRKA